MPRFCANLSMLFPDLPLPQRIGAARAAGFEAVEILFPYEVNSAELLGPLRQAGLPLALINGPPPSYAGGPRGFAAIPGGQARFAADLKRALRYVDALGAQHLHLMAGVAEGPKARAAFVENLRHAVQTAPAQSFTIEPLNPADMPGYFLSDFDLAMDILDEIDAPNLHLQFDAYHAHRITGDVVATWAKTRRRVAHVQIAGYPGRHEPTGRDIDYPEIFAVLDADGYDGWVSAEYNPKGDTVAGLGWLP